MFLELHISKDNKNSYRKLCISKDEMFNTWRYVFIPDLNEDDLECHIKRQQFPNETLAIKELLNIPGIVGVKELVALSSTYKAFAPVEDFVKEYYKGEN